MSNAHAPTPRVFFAASVAAIGGLLFGYDTAVINGANSYLTAHFALTPAQEGLAGASAILGCIPGALLAGSLADRFGRRRLLALCGLLFAVSALWSALPRTFEQFLWARVLGGLGIGGASMVCPVYIAEIAPSRWRGRLGVLFQLGIVLGIFATLFLNRSIQGWGDEAWNTASGWRWMLGMEAAPALAFLGLLLAVPESPRWLALRGNTTAAARVLARLHGSTEASRELTAIQAETIEKAGSFRSLLTGPAARPLLLAVVLMACSQFCGINAIMYYSTRIFTSGGAGPEAAFTASVWVGFINLVFTVIALGLVDRAGRRPLLLVGTAVQGIALGLVGWMFHQQLGGLPLLLCVAGFIAAFALALGPVGWLFCSEIFPNRVRGQAMSVAAFTVWVCCYVVAQTFPMMHDSASIGPARTFWIYAAISLFAFVFVLAFVPETKGRSLETIAATWKRS